MRWMAPLFLSLFLCVSALGQNHNIYAFAGGQVPPNNVPATSAGLPSITGVASDAAGNTYIAVVGWNAIFRIDATTGQLTRVAGTGSSGYSGDDGPATSAQLNAPSGVALDESGNLYIADTGNNIIRKVSGAVITTFAGRRPGNGTAGYSGDNGPATNAQLSSPGGVAVDAAGDVYIADTSNNVIRKVSNGTIDTIAGTGRWGYSGDNGPAKNATLNGPEGVAVDAIGNLYIADTYDQVIRKVSKGVITTIAGDGYGAGLFSKGGYSGDNGPATRAELNQPLGVAVDASGNVYIADYWNNMIRKVSNGIITTIAGNGTIGHSGDSGPATRAELNGPWGVAVDASGNVYIADTYNGLVRKVSSGTITTFAGIWSTGGFNGTSTGAGLGEPIGVSADASGNLYIADNLNNVVRKVSNGEITTIAGSVVFGYSSDHYSGDNGPATSAVLNEPVGVAVDPAGNVYIADRDNCVIRKVSNGVITTMAGNGTEGYSGDNGPATSATLNLPEGVATDTHGNVYIADTGNHVVRKVSNGVITTFAGSGPAGGSPGNNGPATGAALGNPTGVAVDAMGNVYIADSSNNVIREVSNGVITTIAGNWAPEYSGDNGPATSAGLSGPESVAVDATGNLYIADRGNQVIRKVSNGMITTIAGNGHGAGGPFGGYSGDSGLATDAELNGPMGVAVDASGNVYIADTRNNVIRVLPDGLSAHAASLSAAAAVGSLPVNVPMGVSWAASSNASWITITGGASGSGSGTVSFSLQPNTGAARTGTITVAGQTFTVEQESASTVGLNFAGSLAQIASAGGWDTSLTMVNLGDAPGEARLNLYAGDGTTPWLPFTYPQKLAQGTSLGATFDLNLGASATLVLDTTGPAGQASVVGSAQLLTSGAIDGFAIFQIQSTGQQAVVPLETRNAPSYLLAFDHTNGLKTGLALANVSATADNVKVLLRDDAGAVIPTRIAAIPLLSNGHASFMLDDPTQGFPEIEGKCGTVEFDTPSGGQISVLGLRAHGKAITTLPVLAQVGTIGGALAQVATGGGWETGFTLVNTGKGAASFTLSFYEEKTGVALPLSLLFPQTGATQTSTSVTQTLAPGATLLIETEGGSASVTCSAMLTTTGQVSGFAIFQILSTAKSFVLAYDNTNGLATGLALANLSAQTTSVPVVVRDDTGATLVQRQIILAGKGHTQFMLTDPAQGFPETASKRGTIEFDTPSGRSISALGIRAVNATNVITTIPVLAKQ